jgi:hypothetical protein
MSKLGIVAMCACIVPLVACAVAPQDEQQERAESTDVGQPSSSGDTGGATEGATSTRPSPELARLTTSTGSTVAFFEPKAGRVLVLETAKVGAITVLTRENQELPLAALYKAIGGTDVPAALLEAEKRELGLRESLPLDGQRARRTRDDVRASSITDNAKGPSLLPTLEPTSPGTAIATGACSASSFVAGGGCPGGGNKNWCLLNWWNGAYESTSSTDLSEAFACADIGSFVFHAQSDDGTVVDWSVLPGWWAHFFFHDNSWPSLPSLRYDIKNAKGSRFQFGGTFYWY